MSLDSGLRSGLVGGAEPESVRQHRPFQVIEVPLTVRSMPTVTPSYQAITSSTSSLWPGWT
ncbi:hypothetical protein [Streptomyces sp. NPDC002520]